MNRFGTHPPAAIAAVRRRLADQSGFGLIEVVVSCFLLAIVVLALLAGIDGPAKTAAGNQQHAIAASLAQQDQDRMHGMRAVDLADYAPPARTQNVGGVNYTITSRGTWQSDASGVQNCLSNSAVVQYVDITSTVTWPAMRGKPVVQESLVAPENGAFNLIAQVQDEKGNAVTGLPVTTVGPTGLTKITNAFGCADFGHVAVGNYQVQYSRPGWVDPGGTTAVSTGATVASGSTATVPGRYAQGAQIDVKFDTKDSNGNVSFVSGQSVTVTNGGLPSGSRIFPSATGPFAPTALYTTPLLFPFVDGYGVYAGSCSAMDPAANRVPAVQTPFGSHPSVTVREPMVNVKVVKSAVAVGNASVKFTPPAGCNETFPIGKTDNSNTAAKGTLGTPLPYTTSTTSYGVCAYDPVSNRRITKPVVNSLPDGTVQQTLDVNAGGSTTGACP